MELTTRESLSALLRGFLKGLVVLLLSFLCVYLLNAKMGAFLDEEREAQRLALRMGTVDIITPEAAQGKLDYHYEGKFNEIYEQNIKADVIFLGTSHIAHGLNPKFLEDEDGVRYFNFAFNGACPTYFKFWYNDVFLASGYPKPKAIVYGVEWFMFDDGWLWRREEMDYKYMRDTKPVQIEDIKEQITDIDSLLSFVFNKTPIIYARDRFFDMFKKVSITPPETEDNADFTPVYDTNGNNTTSYYNGFIAWEGQLRREAAGHGLQRQSESHRGLQGAHRADKSRGNPINPRPVAGVYIRQEHPWIRTAFENHPGHRRGIRPPFY
ncbi:MAG: hypothetical protein AB9835_02775 [Eubacteriales bacterium]